MELKDSDDHRCYLSEYGIPTIQLGNGDIVITEHHFEGESLAGVGFALSSKNEVGSSNPMFEGVKPSAVGVFLQIISTTPESLQVLIDSLNNAKTELEYRRGDKLRPNTRSA